MQLQFIPASNIALHAYSVQFNYQVLNESGAKQASKPVKLGMRDESPVASDVNN